MLLLQNPNPKRSGMDTRTAFRRGKRHTRCPENLLSDRIEPAGADLVRTLRLRRLSVHAHAVAHKVCFRLFVVAHLRPLLGHHRTSAKPRHAARYRTHGAGIQLVCGLVQQPEPDLHVRSHLRIPLHPLDRLVGRAGERLRSLQQDRLEDDLAGKRCCRVDGRKNVGRDEGCRQGGMVGR